MVGRPYGHALPAGTMSGMALRPLSAEELAQTPTLFASFMGYTGTSYKTFGQLQAIYRERSKALHAAEDEASDPRVDRFIDDMASNRWKSDVVMRIGVFDGIVLTIDGIHRASHTWRVLRKGSAPIGFQHCVSTVEERQAPCGSGRGRKTFEPRGGRFDLHAEDGANRSQTRTALRGWLAVGCLLTTRTRDQAVDVGTCGVRSLRRVGRCRRRRPE
jgi:hypothetical protein